MREAAQTREVAAGGVAEEHDPVGDACGEAFPAEPVDGHGDVDQRCSGTAATVADPAVLDVPGDEAELGQPVGERARAR